MDFARNLSRRMKILAKQVFQPRGREAFLRTVARGGQLLDVGCGNDSPYQIKTTRPDIFYVGLDVGDYHQTGASLECADKYIVTPPAGFHGEIEKFSGQMDAIISNHNIEHCDRPGDVVNAMLSALRPGGRIYMAFPCAESVSFPSRQGSLNFYDDPTHRTVPDLAGILAATAGSGCRVEFLARQYRPAVPRFFGFLLEPFSRWRGRLLPFNCTWALYGFETILWISRPESA